MKVRKKFAAALLSVLMVLTLLPAGALADTPTAGVITIKDSTGSPRTTSTYNAYQIASFSASVDPSTNKTVYTDPKIVDAYKPTVVAALKAAGLATTGTDDVLLNELNSLKADQTLALAFSLQGVAVGGASIPTASVGGQISIPAYGYYLIDEASKSSDDTTLYTDPILVGVPLKDASTITAKFDVKVKSSYAGVQKKIVVPDPNVKGNTLLVDSSTAAVGDTVNYESLSDIPFYSPLYTTPTYTLDDTFSDGLKYTGITDVSIVNGSGTPLKTLSKDNGDYSLSNETDHTFSLTLSPSLVMTYGANGGKLKVHYTALVLDSAKKGSTGNPNSITLEYSDKPNSHTHKTPPDTVITYINLLTINKFDDKDSHVQNAVFDLYQQNDDKSWPADGSYIEEEKTDYYGNAPFTKLVAGHTYKIKEKSAPAGLSLAADIIFTVTAKNGTETIPSDKINIIVSPTDTDNKTANSDIQTNFTAAWSTDNSNIVVGGDGTMSTRITDNRGFTLPGTGGIGTTIFFVSGIAILLLGGCMALVYTKKRKHTGSHFQH